MKRLKLNLSLIAVLALTGCALFSPSSTQEAKLQDVQNLSYAAASIGTSVALAQNPGWRPGFETAYNDLDQMLKSKLITGLLLRNVISSLPVKELKSDTARIAIEGATTLYDATVGDKINVENQPYVVAAATGIRDGMGVALGK